MPVNVVAEETITVGVPTVIEGDSPSHRYGVVFEDDGTTGYFYARDFSRKGNSIVDAVHIYNVENVTDRAKPSLVQLCWSRDGLKSVLLINKWPHAVFNFETRRGYCRTGIPLPPKSGKWGRHRDPWDEKALDLLFK